MPVVQHFVKVIWGDGTSLNTPEWLYRLGVSGHRRGVAIRDDADQQLRAEVLQSEPRVLQAVEYLPNQSRRRRRWTGREGVLPDTGGDLRRSPFTGPTEVAAGVPPATYTYTSIVPVGATATITPTCEGGEVTGQTTSSFTCVFADVAAKTAAHVKLQATILTNTFERTLDVNILTRPTAVSAITGPTTVTAGTTATYTYTGDALVDRVGFRPTNVRCLRQRDLECQRFEWQRFEHHVPVQRRG